MLRRFVPPLEVALISFAAGLASLYLCWRVLGLTPHIPDETSYAFQGRIFASGRLWLEPPLVPEAFAVDHILLSADRWCSIYPPGWPLLLAAGWIAHAPWLVNPLLLMLSVIGVWRLGSDLFDNRTGMLASALFAVSPFVLLMGAGFMAHTASLCASVWCVVFLTRPTAERSRRLLFAAGILGGFAFLIRPYTAVLLLWPACLWCIWRGKQGRRIWRCLGWLFLGFIPEFIAFLFYNRLLFGNFFAAGYNLDPSWSIPVWSASYFVKNLPWYARSLEECLWGWPWPDLLILLPLFRPRYGWKRDLLMAGCSASLVLGYCFFFYKDIVYSGPRYVFEIMGFMAILGSRAFLALVDLLQLKMLMWRIVFLVSGTFLFIFPLAFRLPAQIDYHSQLYHGQTHKLVESAEEAGVGENALVLVSGDPYIFRSVFFENALIPSQGPRIFARDLPSLRNQILEAYRRVELWRAEVQLEALPGPNSYTDRWKLNYIHWERLQ